MKTVILVAYYFNPYKGVGAFRLSYWYEKLRKDNYNVYVITSILDSNVDDCHIIRVNDIQNSFWNKVIGDKSYYWGRRNKTILQNLLVSYPNATVIITGGPFLHIKPFIELKRYYPNSKWIIDYRDPLANNPLHIRKSIFGKIRRFIKIRYEKNINKKADHIITVNSVCKELVVGNKSISIIENGYDERKFNKLINPSSREKIIVYAGKLNQSRNINPFVGTIKSLNSMTFYYIGDSQINEKSSNIKNLGILDYTTTSNILSKCSIGLIIATGSQFESTTKIFDYYAANLKILIVTSGMVKTGVLHELSKNNPNVEWAENNKSSILMAIKRLDRPYKEWDYSEYSRYEGYLKLRKIIENL